MSLLLNTRSWKAREFQADSGFVAVRLCLIGNAARHFQEIGARAATGVQHDNVRIGEPARPSHVRFSECGERGEPDSGRFPGGESRVPVSRQRAGFPSRRLGLCAKAPGNPIGFDVRRGSTQRVAAPSKPV
jgi:hypothetical protein